MYWCSACRAAHEALRESLWLEGDPQPPTHGTASPAAPAPTSVAVAAPEAAPPSPSSPALVRQALNGSGAPNAASSAAPGPRREASSDPDDPRLPRDKTEVNRRRDLGTRAPGP